jgi:hypothetical protein
MTIYLHLETNFKSEYMYFSLPPYIFILWCLVNTDINCFLVIRLQIGEREKKLFYF